MIYTTDEIKSGKYYTDDSVWFDVDLLFGVILEQREKNPYPLDIFVSREGKAAHNAWLIAHNDLMDKLREIQKEKAEGDLPPSSPKE